MKRISAWRLVAALCLAAGILSGCSINPGLRKQQCFQSGQRYFQKGDYRAAAIEFSHAIRIDPGYADAHLQLAETYLKMQQPDRAYAELADVVQLRPNDYQSRIRMTGLLIAAHRFADAREQTTLLLGERPNDPVVHSMLSSLLAAQGDIQGAIAEMQKTIALAPGKWDSYLALALLQVKNNQPVAAEASFRKVIALDPDAMQPRVLLGNFYMSGGRLSDAEQEYRDAMRIDPGSMEPREALARLDLAEDQPAAAEGILLQAAHDLPNNPQSLLALSNYYFITGNTDKAVGEYSLLYRQRPNDLQVKKKFIQLLIQANRFDQARPLIGQVLQASPHDSDALLDQSEIQISAGDVSDAIPTLQAVIRNSPDNSEAHYALGLAFRKQGNPERAQGEWREALRLNPDSLGAERALADSAMEQGDMRSLDGDAMQLIRMEPGSPQGYSLRALAEINLKEYGPAEQDIQKAIAVAPQSGYGYVQLGNLRFAQQRYADAQTAYRTALDRDSGSLDAVRGLANTYIAEKQVDKAVAAVNAGIAGSPSDSNLYTLLGSILFHNRRDLSGAEAAFSRAVSLDPHNVDAWLQLSEAQATQGKVDLAISTSQQALKINPGRVAFCLLLGDLYEAGSQWKDAAEAYQSALAMSSQNPVASMGLARVMLETGGNLDVALSLAETARREMPGSPAAADATGWVYYQKGLYSLALTCLQQALSLQQSTTMPDNPDIRYHLGMTYAKVRQPALARQQLEQVLKTDPGYRNAAEIRQELAGLRS
ncbi:MAG: tetratricopeptide repeat protein [Acidobacteriaceae bacterium]